MNRKIIKRKVRELGSFQSPLSHETQHYSDRRARDNIAEYPFFLLRDIEFFVYK